MAILIDELFGRLGYKYDPSGMKKFERGISQARARLDSMARLAAVVGAGVTAALGFTGNTILRFERKQNELSSVLSKATSVQLKRLSEQALMLGSTTPKSASQATEAQTELARSGFTVNEVFAATPAVLNSAIAGNLDMATAAKLVAGSLRSYGWEAEKADRMSDILASTTANSAFSMNELRAAMTPIAPLAKKAKLPFENMMAALGVLRTRQFRPEMAGTALRNILAILNEKPSPKVEEGFTKLGLTWAGVNKEFRDTKDIIGVLGTLRSAGLDLPTGLAIFGREAGPAALALADATFEGHALEKVLEDSQGTADKMRKLMSKGLPGEVDKLKSAFEGLQLVLGKAGVTGALEKAAKAVTDVINAIAAAPPKIRALIASALLAGPALLGVGAGLKGISFALGGLVPVATGVGMAAGRMRSSVGRASKGIKTGFATTWMAVSGGASAAFIAAREAAVVSFAAIKRSKRRLDATLAFSGVRGVAATLFSPFRRAGVVAYAAVGEAARVVVSPITGVYAAVKKHGVFGLMQAAAVSAYAGVRYAAAATVAPITGVYAAVKKHGVFGAMQVAAVTAFAGIKVAAAGLQTSLVAVFKAVGGAARLMWLAIGGPVGLAIAAVVLAVIAAWKPLSTFFSGLTSGIKDGSGDIGDAFDKLLDALGPVGDGIRGVFNALGDVWTWLINLFGDQSDEGKSWGEAIVVGIVAAIEAITDLVNWFKDLWALLAAAPEDAFGWIGREFDAAMAGLEGMVPDWARSIFGLDDEAPGANASGVGMMGAVGEGIDSGKGAAVGAVENVAEEMRDFFGSSDAKRGPLSDITAAGRSIIETLAKGVRQAEPLRAALTAGALALPPTADLLANLPVGPPIARQSAFGGERGATTISVNIGQGAIVIHAPGGDPREIAAALGSEMLRESMRALSEELDSVIES